MKRSPVVLACIGLFLALLAGTGCSTLQSNQTTSADALAETDSTTAAAPDTAAAETPPPLDPEVAALYDLEARIVAAADKREKATLLEEAMTRLVALLDKDSTRLQNPDFRAVHRGLLAEYRRFHGYEPSDSLEVAQGDIFAIRSDLFDAINAVDNPMLEDVMPAPDAERPSTSVPLTTNRAVKRSIAYLQEAPNKHVNKWLQRAQTYFPMIEHILDEENVPEELKHLAMVESGLNPQARSWAGAVGMWQFMRGTGRAYDLTVNAWVDERRDPEKATRAAAQHLRDLYEDFNDWHLALAAYNCGAGCVKRAQRRSGGTSYWDIYDRLPRETRGYVPMFIASTLVASDPGAYGFDEAPSGPAYAYDYVAVRGSMLSLGELANLAGTERSVLRALNPELRRGTVPPSKGYYHLRIPLGQYERFMRRYAALPDAKKRPATTYRVRSGDTLSELAARYGTSTRQLQRLNGIRGTTIRVGQQLVVPVADYESAFTASTDEARPMRVQYGAAYPVQPIPSAIAASSEADQSPFRTASLDESTEASESSKANASEKASASENNTASSEEPSTQTETTSSEPATPSTYRVRQGDTLSEIADRFDEVSLSDLRRWNGLMSSRIYVGQTLRLKPGDEPVEQQPATMTYRVRRGDTLSEIAERFGTSTRALRSTNNLRGSRISIGQTLEVPSSGSSKRVHRVRSGDTLGKIAQRYGVSIQEVMAWNNLSRSTIYPGQELVILQ